MIDTGRLRTEAEKVIAEAKFFLPRTTDEGKWSGRLLAFATLAAAAADEVDRLKLAYEATRDAQFALGAWVAKLTGRASGGLPADGGDVWLAVLADMESRRLVGIDRYGKPVRAGDDAEDWTQHAYEEAMDLCVYLKAKMLQRAEK